jgi:hypothetical protein
MTATGAATLREMATAVPMPLHSFCASLDLHLKPGVRQDNGQTLRWDHAQREIVKLTRGRGTGAPVITCFEVQLGKGFTS